MTNPFSFNYQNFNAEISPIIQNAWDGLSNAINSFYDSENTSELKPQYQNKNLSSTIWSAGSSFAMWWLVQAFRKSNDLPLLDYGASFSNPFVLPWDPTDTRKLIANGFGVNSDPNAMCRAYGAKGVGSCAENRYGDTTEQNGIPTSIQLTLFNLGLCNPDVQNQENGQHAFEWDSNGNLKIYDRYNFDSQGDFSPSGAENPVIALLAVVAGVITILPGFDNFLNDLTSVQRARKIWNQWKLIPEPDEDFDSNPQTDRYNILGVPVLVQSMYTVNTITPSQLLEANPPLFWDAVAKGRISGSALSTAISNVGLNQSLPVGEKQPSPLLGFPRYLPNTMEISKQPSSWLFGSSDNYPRPFTSFSQEITTANNILGPYAKITGGGIQLNSTSFQNPFNPPISDDLERRAAVRVGQSGYQITDLDNYALVCEDSSPTLIDLDFPGSGGIPGRMIIITSGIYIGELGFCHQPWDTFDDGPFNTDTGTSGGEPFDSKEIWWTKCATATVEARWINMPGFPLVKVSVAYKSSVEVSDDFYNPNYPISSQENLTLLLSTILLASTLGKIV
jgi:hypothetical protein